MFFVVVAKDLSKHCTSDKSQSSTGTQCFNYETAHFLESEICGGNALFEFINTQARLYCSHLLKD